MVLLRLWTKLVARQVRILTSNRSNKKQLNVYNSIVPGIFCIINFSLVLALLRINLSPRTVAVVDHLVDCCFARDACFRGCVRALTAVLDFIHHDFWTVVVVIIIGIGIRVAAVRGLRFFGLRLLLWTWFGRNYWSDDWWVDYRRVDHGRVDYWWVDHWRFVHRRIDHNRSRIDDNWSRIDNNRIRIDDNRIWNRLRRRSWSRSRSWIHHWSWNCLATTSFGNLFIQVINLLLQNSAECLISTLLSQ